MKKFLVGIFTVFCITISLATVIQVVINVRGKNKSLNGHDHFHAVKNELCDIVFLGSSRCVHTYSPAIFKEKLGLNTYNLGIDGHGDLAIHLMRLKDFLKYNPKPKNVIFNVDPMIVYNPMNYDSNKIFGEKQNFARFAFFSDNDGGDIRRYFQYNLGEKYVPLYALTKYKVLFQSLTMKEGKIWTQNRGFLSEGPATWDSVGSPLSKQSYHCKATTFLNDYDSIKTQLKLMADFCKNENIHFICIQLPAFSTLYSEKHFQAVSKMCTDLGIDFLDYSGNPKYYNDISLFRDPYHFNIKGTEVFSNLICADSGFISLIHNNK